MYLALACVAHSLGCAGEASAGPVPGISRPKMIASGPGSGQATPPQETEVKIGIRSGIHGRLRTLLKMVSDVHARGAGRSGDRVPMGPRRGETAWMREGESDGEQGMMPEDCAGRSSTPAVTACLQMIQSLLPSNISTPPQSFDRTAPQPPAETPSPWLSPGSQRG